MASDPAWHQRTVWERIADSFDRSRSRTWRHVEEFLEQLTPGSRVLDLMCGNGRHTGVATRLGHRVVSLDWSRGLVSRTHERYGTGVVADATQLPFQDEAFDAVIYVAGWHGIPTEQGREDSLRELHRVLRSGGDAQITNWSRDAPRFQRDGEPGQAVDVIIPWRSDGHDEQRTYHLTTRDGFQAQCEAVGFTVTESFDASIVAKAPAIDNHVIVARK